MNLSTKFLSTRCFQLKYRSRSGVGGAKHHPRFCARPAFHRPGLSHPVCWAALELVEFPCVVWVMSSSNPLRHIRDGDGVAMPSTSVSELGGVDADELPSKLISAPPLLPG